MVIAVLLPLYNVLVTCSLKKKREKFLEKFFSKRKNENLLRNV